MADQNEASVRALIEVLFNQKQAGLASAFYAPECEGSSPDGPIHGWNGFRSLFDKYLEAFPDFRLTVNYLLSVENKVVVHYTFQGTQTGSLAGYRATGKAVTVPGIMISRIANSRIVEQHWLWDNLAPRRQMWLTSMAGRLNSGDSPDRVHHAGSVTSHAANAAGVTHGSATE